ncbi:MAG: methylmalonyl-CoA epimerase [Paracoccaceae bacterium]|nr:methylmalonyl-CoA epimerase [Paracoccaceae bacterium]
MIGSLNHVAIAVPDLNSSIQTYQTLLGASVSDKVEQIEHGVTVAFIDLPNTKVELITPLGHESPINNFLKKNPNGGLHHICYGVKNIHKSQRILVKAGAKLIGDGKPKLGAHGKLVIFLHPKDFNGTLIELEEI